MMFQFVLNSCFSTKILCGRMSIKSFEKISLLSGYYFNLGGRY